MSPVYPPGHADILPPELFQRIFLLVQIETTSRLPGQRFRLDHSWMAVCHVCQYWRDIATHYGALWAKIELGARKDPIITELMLARCPPTTLMDVFIYHDSRHAFTWNLEAVHSHIISRARSLDVENLAWPGIELPLESAAQHLQSLHLRAGDNQILLDVPRNLFGGHAPCLQDLDMHGCRFNWCTLVSFPTLTKLTIRKYQSESSNMSILAMIQMLPILRSLDLELPANPTAIAHVSEDAVTLNALTTLNLYISSEGRSHSAGVGRFLKHCKTPSVSFFSVELGAICRLVQEQNSTWLMDRIRDSTYDDALLELLPSPLLY